MGSSSSKAEQPTHPIQPTQPHPAQPVKPKPPRKPAPPIPNISTKPVEINYTPNGTWCTNHPDETLKLINQYGLKELYHSLARASYAIDANGNQYTIVLAPKDQEGARAIELLKPFGTVTEKKGEKKRISVTGSPNVILALAHALVYLDSYYHRGQILFHYIPQLMPRWQAKPSGESKAAPTLVSKAPTSSSSGKQPIPDIVSDVDTIGPCPSNPAELEEAIKATNLHRLYDILASVPSWSAAIDVFHSKPGEEYSNDERYSLKLASDIPSTKERTDEIKKILDQFGKLSGGFGVEPDFTIRGYYSGSRDKIGLVYQALIYLDQQKHQNQLATEYVVPWMNYDWINELDQIPGHIYGKHIKNA